VNGLLEIKMPYSLSALYTTRPLFCIIFSWQTCHILWVLKICNSILPCNLAMFLPFINQHCAYNFKTIFFEITFANYASYSLATTPSPPLRAGIKPALQKFPSHQSLTEFNF